MEREKDKMQSTRKNGKHLRVFLSDVFFQSVYYNLLLPNFGRILTATLMRFRLLRPSWSLKQFGVCSCPHEYHPLIRAAVVQLIDQ
jgi:hypothetical protein